MPKILSTVLGADYLKKIQQQHLLVVGVGGIGCEILKLVSKSGFRKITIFDYDQIEETNLNRQFYFRRHHIGMAKSLVGKQSILKIDPDLEIEAIKDNIFEGKYNIKFFLQFDVVLSALDNFQARKHLAMMALKCNKPFVDAGSEAFTGNVRSIIKNLNQCYGCTKRNQKGAVNLAICTIRNNPETPLHCIAFAKHFFQSFFGSATQENALSGDFDNFKQEILELKKANKNTTEELSRIARNLFDEIFFKNIQSKKLIIEKQKSYRFVQELTFKEAVENDLPLKNPLNSTYDHREYLNQSDSQYDEQKIWSLKRYAEKFIQSFVHFSRLTGQNTVFQKDDEYSMLLVYCVTCLRTYNFLDEKSSKNKLKYLSFYTVKDIAGRIVPAISSTNAIVASVEIMETMKIINNQQERLQIFSFENTPSNRKYDHILRYYPSTESPSIKCEVCSDKNILVYLRGNFQFINKDVLQQYMRSSYFPFRSIEIYIKGFFSQILNKKRVLKEFPQAINGQKFMTLRVGALENCGLSAEIFFEHLNTPDNSIEMIMPQTIADMKRKIINYLRKNYDSVIKEKKRSFQYYGIL